MDKVIRPPSALAAASDDLVITIKFVYMSDVMLKVGWSAPGRTQALEDLVRKARFTSRGSRRFERIVHVSELSSLLNSVLAPEDHAAINDALHDIEADYVNLY